MASVQDSCQEGNSCMSWTHPRCSIRLWHIQHFLIFSIQSGCSGRIVDSHCRSFCCSYIICILQSMQRLHPWAVNLCHFPRIYSPHMAHWNALNYNPTDSGSPTTARSGQASGSILEAGLQLWPSFGSVEPGTGQPYSVRLSSESYFYRPEPKLQGKRIGKGRRADPNPDPNSVSNQRASPWSTQLPLFKLLLSGFAQSAWKNMHL